MLPRSVTYIKRDSNYLGNDGFPPRIFGFIRQLDACKVAKFIETSKFKINKENICSYKLERLTKPILQKPMSARLEVETRSLYDHFVYTTSNNIESILIDEVLAMGKSALILYNNYDISCEPDHDLQKFQLENMYTKDIDDASPIDYTLLLSEYISMREEESDTDE